MKAAVILFNLGGPDSKAAINKFRKNLFSDPFIIRAPKPIRLVLARYIAARTAKAAAHNYAYLDNKSPLLAHTKAQAAALQTALGDSTQTFIAMRYWHPLTAETVAAVKSYDPDHILLLPLYPQFSTTTTGSSLFAWHEAAAAAGLAKPTTTICCYFADPAYITAIAALVAQAIATAKATMPPGVKLRLLFSAHGLPKTIVDKGDPYQFQIEATVALVMQYLAEQSIEHVVCYQSRATPQKWLEPSTATAIKQAGAEKTAVLVVPIAFVSDHIETLVELDIENRELAAHAGVPAYFRAPVPNAEQKFIAALASLATRALSHGPGLCSYQSARACGPTHKDCPFKHAA